jgi:hypothetical protein
MPFWVEGKKKWKKGDRIYSLYVFYNYPFTIPFLPFPFIPSFSGITP